MSRFYVFMLTVLILVLIAFLLGWFQVTSSTDQSKDKVKVELSVDKAKVKDDAAAAAAKAEELGRTTKEEVRDVARKIGNLAGDKPTWKLEQSSMVLAPGEMKEVKLSRSGSDLKSMKAGVFASAGSNLIVSGGVFNEGETTSHITVEAPRDAHDGTVTVVADHKSETLSVTVKPGPGGNTL